MNNAPLIHLVDDDAASIDFLEMHLRALRLDFRRYGSAEAFLEQQFDRPGCLIACDRLAGIGAAELHAELERRGIDLPVILMTAKPQTQMIVDAMRQGAIAVLDKPCECDALWKAIEAALATDADRRYRRSRQASMQQRLESLTPQEREVMWQIVDGAPNKITARRLAVSVRTIENRRRSIFAKLGIRSVAELVTTVMQASPEQTRPVSGGLLAGLDIADSESLLCNAG